MTALIHTKDGKARLEILEEMCGEKGVEIVSVVPAKGSHFRATLAFGSERRTVVFTCSKSDRRALLNFRMDTKKTLRAMGAG